MNIDIAIIGGGPAGVTAGTVLRKKGYSCIIIDKMTFPRDKLCGGVLTKKTIKKVTSLYDNTIFSNIKVNYVDKFEFYDMYKKIDNYKLKNGFSVVDRKELDHELMNYYIKIGGVLSEGQREYVIDYEQNMITLDNGDIIYYKVLIGADGINSQVRKYVTSQKIPQVFCFEKFVPVGELHPGNKISIYFGIARFGYAWKIPSYKNLGIGMGEVKITDSKKTCRKFLDYCKFADAPGDKEIKGAAVSIGKYIGKPAKGNVLLIGDAAGLIDAITGEGIFFAVYSAEIAALTVVRYLKKDEPLSNYNQNIKKIHNIMNEQNFYNKFLYAPFIQKLILAYVKANRGYALILLNEVISTYHLSFTRAYIKWQKHLFHQYLHKN